MFDTTEGKEATIVSFSTVMKCAAAGMLVGIGMTSSQAAIHGALEGHVLSGQAQAQDVAVRPENVTIGEEECGGDPPPMPGGPDALGTYYGVVFRFKAHDDLGGTLGLLWDRQEGAWRIVSYGVIQF